MDLFQAVWDTGATSSVITPHVVSECGLKPTGRARVNGVFGTEETDTYLVSVNLPNNYLVSSISVPLGRLGLGVDVLIGMDIISQGDFAITSRYGRTKFSFRCPSRSDIDFVAESDR